MNLTVVSRVTKSQKMRSTGH